jgi:osmotically inducible protein OsmC
MAITRSADAVWRGGGKDGSGSLSTASGALSQVPYSLGKRFGDEPGTNPEELIGAAHAGCFAMALAVQLAGAGHAPEELRAHADVRIEQQDGGWRITAIKLSLEGRVPGISQDEFLRLAEAAKNGCPVSNALKPDISLDAKLA